MRLINTETLALEEFLGEDIPPYAILSHRWETEEVSFQEMLSGKGPGKKGYDKIVQCCSRADSDYLKYAWIDTCCIDKTSSAELSEAVNSMYSWYSGSMVCYVYLADVASLEEIGTSLWFTRGWTLQELIAPESVYFFSKNWACLGTKSSLPSSDRFQRARDENYKDVPMIVEQLFSITNIEIMILLSTSYIKRCSIAQRMSWAVGRKTTRLEDRAYCLLGLFDINMALLYGEGRKAFVRLQEEIIKQSDDHSIFAWTASDSAFDDAETVHGLIGENCDFFGSYLGPCAPSAAYEETNEAYSVTNRGLSIKMFVGSWTSDICLAFLNCQTMGAATDDDDDKGKVWNAGVFLRKLEPSNSSSDQFMRVRLGQMFYVPAEAETPARWNKRAMRISIRERVPVSLRGTDFNESPNVYGVCALSTPPTHVYFDDPSGSYSVKMLRVYSLVAHFEHNWGIEAEVRQNSTPIIFDLEISSPREMRLICQVHLDPDCNPYCTLSGFISYGQPNLPDWARKLGAENPDPDQPCGFCLAADAGSVEASSTYWKDSRTIISIKPEGIFLSGDRGNPIWNDQWLVRFQQIREPRNEDCATGTDPGVNAFIYRQAPLRGPSLATHAALPPFQLFRYPDINEHYFNIGLLPSRGDPNKSQYDYDDGFVEIWCGKGVRLILEPKPVDVVEELSETDDRRELEILHSMVPLHPIPEGSKHISYKSEDVPHPRRRTRKVESETES